MKLFDTHVHLTDSRYENVDTLIAQLAVSDIDRVMCVGYDIQSSRGCIELADKYSNVYAAVGVHPHDSGSLTDDDCHEIIRMTSNPKVRAIGEIGLDYHYDSTDRVAQKLALNKQLDIVATTKLPVIFHLRDAYEDMLSIVKANMSKICSGGIFHCFSGSLETARIYIQMGFYISFSGSITFKKADFGDIIRAVPIDRLLIETDCPYLSPQQHRGQLNQPSYVRLVAERIAVELGKSLEWVATTTYNNANRIFAI